MTTARTAIVGLGTVSFEHIAKLQAMPGVQIVGLCDLSATLASAVAERFGVGPPYTDLTEMLATGRPDVVHVLTPPQTHLGIVGMALDAGAHVLVEKPIAPTWDDYVAMREAAVRHDRLLVENYNYRFMPDVLRALDIVAAGAVGEVVHVDATFGVTLAGGSPYADRDVPHFAHALPGGALQNFVSHPISVALAFTGESSAIASARRRLGSGALGDDELRALLAGPRTTALVGVTGNARPAGFVVRVEATKGAVEVDVWNRRLRVDTEGGGLAKLANGIRGGAGEVAATGRLLLRAATARQDYFAGLATLLERFYAAVADRSIAPPVSLDEMDRVNRAVAEVLSPERRL
jgi:predicted dehydrogenase